jgi:hypothetical protein
MKKVAGIAFIALFFALCAVPLVGLILGYENANAEKRALAQAPELFREEGFNVEFTREFDDYYSDNFAFRPNLVTLYAQVNAALFAQSASDQVIVGRDGWLFFTPTLKDYEHMGMMSEDEISRLVKTLAIQQAWLENRGVDFIFTVAPNKASLYGQYMPERYIVSNARSNAEMLGDALPGSGVNYVNLFDALSGSDVQLYHKLDTHWNNTGALTAANMLLSRLKELNPEFEYVPFDLAGYTVEMGWHGDLGAMLYPTANLLDAQHAYGIEKRYTGRFQSPEDIIIRTACGEGSLDLLMMRDSFANALILPLSNTFSTVTYSRAVPYDYFQLTADMDAVILEIAERNLPNMILQAPLLPAPPVPLPEEIQPAEMQTAFIAEDEGDYIRISGYALPPGYAPHKSYDICVRLAADGKEYGFMPFPISAPEYADHANAAFTLRIEKSALPEGEYALDVVLWDGMRYMADTAGFVTVIR